MVGPRRQKVRALRWRLAVVLVGVALAGCGSKAKTVEEVRREYALKLLEGFSIGYYDIRASRADPNTDTLYDLTLQDGDTLIHADEARIVVDAKTRSVSLELKGVVGADAKTGRVMKLDDLNSGAVKLAGPIKK